MPQYENADVLYGRSPLLEALPAVRAWNALPPEQRAFASARHVECKMAKRELSQLASELAAS